MLHHLAAFALALVLCLLLTPLVRVFSFNFGFVAMPRKDRWSQKATPLMGGIAIFFSFLLAFFIFFYQQLQGELLGLLIGCTLVFLLGVVDDVFNLKPQTKLLGQIVAACAVVPFGVVSAYFNPLVGIPLTIFWIVGITNSFNLLDNMDGLSAGIAFISAAVLFTFCVTSPDQAPVMGTIATLTAILCGSTLGFLFYNFNPASIFMGDCGSLFLGYALAVTSVIGNYHDVSSVISTLLVPVMILLIPIFDTTLVTVMRRLHNRPVSQGGKDHISHRLVRLGLPEKRAVIFLYVLSLVCGSVGVSYRHFSPLSVSLLILLCLCGLVLFGLFLGEIRVYADEPGADAVTRKFEGSENELLLDGMVMHKRRIVEVLLDFCFICAAFVGACLLRFDGAVGEGQVRQILMMLPVLIPIRLLVFDWFAFYRGIWRYAGVYDALNIFRAVTVACLLSGMVLALFFDLGQFPRSILVIDFLLLTFLAIGARLSFRLLSETFQTLRRGGRRLLIHGRSDEVTLLLNQLRHRLPFAFQVVGMLDNQAGTTGNVIAGIPVLGTLSDLPEILANQRADCLVLSEEELGAEKLELVEKCRREFALEILKVRKWGFDLLPPGKSDSLLPVEERPGCPPV